MRDAHDQNSARSAQIKTFWPAFFVSQRQAAHDDDDLCLAGHDIRKTLVTVTSHRRSSPRHQHSYDEWQSYPPYSRRPPNFQSTNWSTSLLCSTDPQDHCFYLTQHWLPLHVWPSASVHKVGSVSLLQLSHCVLALRSTPWYGQARVAQLLISSLPLVYASKTVTQCPAMLLATQLLQQRATTNLPLNQTRRLMSKTLYFDFPCLQSLVCGFPCFPCMVFFTGVPLEGLSSTIHVMARLRTLLFCFLAGNWKRYSPYIPATFNAAKNVQSRDWQQCCSLKDTRPQRTVTMEMKTLAFEPVPPWGSLMRLPASLQLQTISTSCSVSLLC